MGEPIAPGAIPMKFRESALAHRYLDGLGKGLHGSDVVDVVGDAHELSAQVGIHSVDAVFSLAVLEHLAAPWLFASEINRAPRMGGLTFHVAPPSWPLHELPRTTGASRTKD